MIFAVFKNQTTCNKKMKTRTYILSEQKWQCMNRKPIHIVDLFAGNHKLRSMQIF
jgi:hypothetical protein